MKANYQKKLIYLLPVIAFASVLPSVSMAHHGGWGHGGQGGGPGPNMSNAACLAAAPGYYYQNETASFLAPVTNTAGYPQPCQTDNQTGACVVGFNIGGSQYQPVFANLILHSDGTVDAPYTAPLVEMQAVNLGAPKNALGFYDGGLSTQPNGVWTCENGQVVVSTISQNQSLNDGNLGDIYPYNVSRTTTTFSIMEDGNGNVLSLDTTINNGISLIFTDAQDPYNPATKAVAKGSSTVIPNQTLNFTRIQNNAYVNDNNRSNQSLPVYPDCANTNNCPAGL